MVESAFSNTDENRFWLKIMSDKANILFNSLPPDKPEVGEMKDYYNMFESLYARIPQQSAGEQPAQFYNEAVETTGGFRVLTLKILRKQLSQKFYLNVKPSFVNHVVTLTDHYIYLLKIFQQNGRPVYSPIIHDIFWLPTFLVDARLIADNVEFFDESVRSEALEYEKDFIRNYEFAVMLQGFLRTGLDDFPIAVQYRKNISELLGRFAEFVVTLLKQARENRLPGTLTLLELECIYRISCYYTTQLAVLAGTPKPACDPGTPSLF